MESEGFQRRDTEPVQAAPQGEMDALLLGRTKELSTFDPDGRNWRGIFISLLVISGVCSLIFLAIVFLSPVPCTRFKSGRLTLEDLASGKFVPYDFNVSWISGDEIVYQDHEEALILFNARTLTKTILLSNITFRQNHVQRCKLSSDKRFLLLMSNLLQVSRGRWTADYKIYNLITHTPSLLPFANKISLVEWGPAGNQMVIVYDNNLFYIPSVGQAEIRISTNAGQDVFNGILDWFYKERVMDVDRGIWWLADGSKLAFMVIDESLVNDTNFLWYAGNIYPSIGRMKYPRPGDSLPLATMWVSDFKHPPQPVLPPKDILREGYLYITAVSWVDANRLIVSWSPRNQSISWVTLCSCASRLWTCHKLVEVQAKSKHSWTEFISSILPSVDGKSCFVVLQRETTALDSFRHIATVPFQFQDKPLFITIGSYDVVDVLSNDAEGNLFFSGTLEDRPEQKHLFSINTRDTPLASPKCLTRGLKDHCGYSDAIFSPTGRYYILVCRGPQVPKLEVWSVDRSEPLFVLDSYADIRNALGQKSRPKIRDIKIPLPEQYHTTIRVMMPVKVDPEEDAKFPLVLFAGDGVGRYGQVSDLFEIGLPDYFGASRHYVVALLDGRGSRFQGNRMLHAADFNAWESQAEDLATAARYLLKTFPFIDSSRVGILGRGFGGFSTIAVLNDFYSPFSCGVAVAPVTDWKYSDALISERYLGLPNSPGGQERYQNAQFPNGVYGLSNKNFLLVHGTADQDVPVLHSMLLMKRLSAEGAKYRSQIYPDEGHYLTGALHHFYKTLDDFFEQCFRVEVEESSSHILPGFKKSKIMIAG